MKSTITTLALASLLGACSGPVPPAPTPDLKTTADAAEPPDLAEGPAPDLGPLDDLRPPPDLLPPPKLTGLPDCPTANVTAAMLYTQVASLRCTARYCHGITDPVANFSFDSAAEMRSAWADRSKQSALDYVSPRNLDRSYVMWKLMGQHAMVARPGMAGDRMPQPPKEPLTTADLCVFINWIKSGAL